jgi:hypothetical protein
MAGIEVPVIPDLVLFRPLSNFRPISYTYSITLAGQLVSSRNYTGLSRKQIRVNKNAIGDQTNE